MTVRQTDRKEENGIMVNTAGGKLNFLNIPRRKNLYRPVGERIRDFRCVEIFPEKDELQCQASRCMDCGIPFCHAYGCPLGNVIPEMNSAVAEGDFETAWDLLRSTSNFPEFTSRICPALCEYACTAGHVLDPVAVRHTEYLVAEEAFRCGWVRPRAVPDRNGLRAAVIGSGPAGLAVADELNQYGFQVTVYERNLSPGGLLRYGIPDFKLEKTVIDRRIRILEQEGIHFECGTEAGKDLSGAYLKKRHDVIVLAMGTPEARDLKIPGRDLRGIHFALDFLSGENRCVSAELPELPISAKGKKVLVIGGGDTGSDCIGTARRQGAESILQIELMPEPPAERSPSTPWPEFPYMRKDSSSHAEGVERLWSVNSSAFEGRDGAVTALQACRIQWSLNEKGRPQTFRALEDGAFRIETDLVLLAMGFTGVRADEGIVKEFSLSVEKGRIVTDPDMRSLDPRVFVAGDSASGASLVVRAIASGRRCAASVNRILQKGGLAGK